MTDEHPKIGRVGQSGAKRRKGRKGVRAKRGEKGSELFDIVIVEIRCELGNFFYFNRVHFGR